MKKLNHKEELIMQILWKLNKAFVNDLIKEMGDNAPPYNTVSSIIRKLQGEGLVGYEAFGKTHRYFPILKKEDYRKSSFERFMDYYFGGKPEEVLSYFVEEEKINPKELDELLEKLKNKDNGHD